jgi:putative ABC transport system permease protein
MADPSSEVATAVSIATLEQAIEDEQHRWLWETPIGLIFQMGVVISLLVGAAIVYMVLSTDVANRLPEYATLLAMGYSRRYLAGIVLTQATVLCGIGFLASWVMGLGLYHLTSYVSGIPLRMTVTNVVLVAVLGFLMCCISGLLALRKLWKAEPANLF